MSVQPMLSRRQFLSGLAALGGTLAVAACTVPQPTTTGDTASPTLDTILIVIDTRESEVPFKTDTFEWFKENHPNVEVDIRGYPAAEYFTKILALAAAQEEGDLIWGNISGGQYLNFGLRGIIAPLDDFVERDDYDFSPFFPSTVESGRLEDKLYSLPMSGMPSQRPIFYNTELMDGVEFDVTQNWDWTPDDLVDAGLRLTQRDGDQVRVWGFIPDLGYFGLVPWIRTFGGDLLSDDGRECVLFSEEAISCVEFLLSLSNEHGIAPRPEQRTGTGQEMWLGGNAAMTQLSTGALTSVRAAAGFDYGASVGVRHPIHGRSDMNAALHLGIATRSQVQDMAWELGKHYCTYEVGVYKLNTPSGMPAGREDVYNSPEAVALHPGFPLLGQAGQWSKVHTLPWNLRGAEVISTLQNNMDLIWLGQSTVEQGLEMIQEEIQIVLDRPRP